jgi:uncharacterized membrane protein
LLAHSSSIRVGSLVHQASERGELQAPGPGHPRRHPLGGKSARASTGRKVVSERVVLADCLFTLPAILVQLVTGVALMPPLNYSRSQTWLLWSIVLFCLAGLCWMPVVWLQIRMRDLARESEHAGAASPGQVYRVYARV